GDRAFSEGLERLVSSLEEEASLTELGEQILDHRLKGLLANRLRIQAEFASHPEIARESIEGPLVIIGLPRTGTTALSQVLAADPAIRSLRLWESNDPVPPPDKATEKDDPRIAQCKVGLDAMYTTFPKMRSLYVQEPDGPTECQDLLGMAFRTAHFDGMAHVPSYTEWVLQCDMGSAYAMHRGTLQLLQWKCPPRLWHLKTPVHALSLQSLLSAYPDARFLWTHRDPAAVLGSVCSLIQYTRSWVSDRDDSLELGKQQVALWNEAMRRAIEVRDSIGEERFADVHFHEFDADPVSAVERAYEQIELPFGESGRKRVERWASAHRRGDHGVHTYELGDFGLDADRVRDSFAFYRRRFHVDDE
ncbi:MAG TPA: sulfotransferase, partial [Acidimicrobiales bacterium]|nr:sulfotransferase [Acidimicrobiales bacterium]